MIIIHVANIENKKCSGVDVIVPQHLISQSNYAKVALLNIGNININNIAQFRLSYKTKICNLRFVSSSISF